MPPGVANAWRRATGAAVLALCAAGPLRPDGPTDEWPQFRGPMRDGRYEGGDLPRDWKGFEPRVLWKKPVGEGFSSPVISRGRLVLHHRRGDETILECVDAATGAAVWSHREPTTYHDSFGFDEGPRATPSIVGDRVVTHGADGRVSCIDFRTGEGLWSIESMSRFEVSEGYFGAACSPLVEGERVLLNVGGPDGAGIVALELATGRTAWKATDDRASHSSPVSFQTAAGRRTAFFTRRGLAIVDPGTGQVHAELHWRPRIQASVNAASPVVAGRRIFISTSYGKGAILLEFPPPGGTELRRVWASDDALTCHYTTPVLHDGLLYGYHGRQEYRPDLRCVDLATGKVLWSQNRYGSGTVLLAGDRLILMKETGELVVAAASSDRFEILARRDVLPATVRAYPALASGRLYVRNQDTLICLDLRSPGG